MITSLRYYNPPLPAPRAKNKLVICDSSGRGRRYFGKRLAQSREQLRTHLAAHNKQKSYSTATHRQKPHACYYGTTTARAFAALNCA
jgi:hypothetical protein